MNAQCRTCDGTGLIEVPLGEHFYSHNMAIDAECPEMEGQSMGIEWGQEQCPDCKGTGFVDAIKEDK